MSSGFYTLAIWHVRDGQNEEFIRIWREELVSAFRDANSTATGTLIQSLEDAQLFYSFGPWATLDDMEAARENPEVRLAISKLIAVCDEAKPGAFQVVLTVP